MSQVQLAQYAKRASSYVDAESELEMGNLVNDILNSENKVETFGAILLILATTQFTNFAIIAFESLDELKALLNIANNQILFNNVPIENGCWPLSGDFIQYAVSTNNGNVQQLTEVVTYYHFNPDRQGYNDWTADDLTHARNSFQENAADQALLGHDAG